MTKVAIIRCEKNAERCPLTNCFKSMYDGINGFSGYDQGCRLVGVLTCRCPGDNVSALAEILNKKGAEVIHFCTCAFSKKSKDGWSLGQGLCEHMDRIVEQAARASGLPCVKGTAHLPPGYAPEVVSIG
ncbi:MAG: CGGC domain-containing protein [Desulfovibrionaceae bacterium]|nr:CGGC domain-containing protein [Desulfovibrionaceae bacterium]